MSIKECSGLLKILRSIVSFPMAVLHIPDCLGVPFLKWNTDCMYPIGFTCSGIPACDVPFSASRNETFYYIQLAKLGLE